MNTKHIPLIAAIALPILFIIVLALTISLPSSRIKPEFDFVYVDVTERYNDPYYVDVQYKNRYVVTDGKITLSPIKLAPSPYKDISLSYEIEIVEAPTLYFYDVEENTSREISLEEAQKLSVDAGPASPDGYQIKFEYGNDGIFELFGSNDRTGYFITKGNGKKSLSGFDSSYGYYSSDDIELVGWIK